MERYTGPWPYSLTDRSVPASVRLRNLAAIGASRDGHENRFGALPPTLLPASDGSQLPTPAFDSVYGGAAYWGHYVVRRASVDVCQTSVAHIIKAYSTGNATDYAVAVATDAGVDRNERINLWRDTHGFNKLFRVMIAMGRWEAGARSKYGPGYDAFEIMYDPDDPKVTDELFWGMVHGCREAWRDQGYGIDKTPEEMTFVPPQKPKSLWQRLFGKKDK